jgi:D-ala D-ala ligase N-terminal domain protein
MPKKVLVLMGGFSAEREVSLVSGQGAAEALRSCGYEVVAHDLRDVKEFIRVLEAEKPDAVFNALHGNWGEDGEIQGLLDLLQVPYTHSGLSASALGMDKFLTKEICRGLGIKVANGERMTVRAFRERATDLPMPYVVKPVSDGSSVGVFIVHSAADLEQVHYDDDGLEVLAERYVPGRELTCAVIGGKAYAVTELRPRVKFYDYHNKYTAGATEHLLPAEIPEDAAETCKRYAERLHKALGCKTVSRCDFRYNPEDGVVFLEINTHPGMTPLSLVPEQAKYAGISYAELCRMLVEEAGCRPR